MVDYILWVNLLHSRNRNRKLKISTAPTKAKYREPAFSQAFIQKKIDMLRAR